MSEKSMIRVDNDRVVEIQPVAVNNPIRDSRVGMYCKVVSADGNKDFSHIYYASKQDVDHGPCYLYGPRGWYTCMVPIREHVDFNYGKRVDGLRNELSSLRYNSQQLVSRIIDIEEELINLGVNF